MNIKAATISTLAIANLGLSATVAGASTNASAASPSGWSAYGAGVAPHAATAGRSSSAVNIVPAPGGPGDSQAPSPTAADGITVFGAPSNGLSRSTVLGRQLAFPANTAQPSAINKPVTVEKGCIYNATGVSAAGPSVHGYMHECARGNLEVHEWIEEDGIRVTGVDEHSCDGSTGCDLPTLTYGGDPDDQSFKTVVHGMNHSTGHDDYVEVPVNEL